MRLSASVLGGKKATTASGVTSYWFPEVSHSVSNELFILSTYPGDIVHPDHHSLLILIGQSIEGQSQLDLLVLKLVRLLPHGRTSQEVRDDADGFFPASERRASRSAWVATRSVRAHSVEHGIEAIETSQVLFVKGRVSVLHHGNRQDRTRLT